MSKTPKYRVRTWDSFAEDFTKPDEIEEPHENLSLYELRLALRRLQDRGYQVNRRAGDSDPAVLVERMED